MYIAFWVVTSQVIEIIMLIDWCFVMEAKSFLPDDIVEGSCA